MSAQNFGGRKIFHTARLLKNMILDFRKISGNLGILRPQQMIFLKSTTKTIYICTYTINLWSLNNFLIDVATSLCRMVGMTFEPRGLSGNHMSPTLARQQQEFEQLMITAQYTDPHHETILIKYLHKAIRTVGDRLISYERA